MMLMAKEMQVHFSLITDHVKYNVQYYFQVSMFYVFRTMISNNEVYL